MSSREIRKARQAHGHNAFNPALPDSAALAELAAHLRDTRRTSRPVASANGGRGTTTKGK